MLHYCLVHVAYHLSRWLPKHQRLKFQIITTIFVTLILAPQLYVLTSVIGGISSLISRPKSSRYCQQPLLNNLACFIVLSLVATGFAVVFTLLDPVPQAFKAAFHAFGVVSFAEGLCTTVLTASATTCAKTTPELYYLSYVLSWACILTTAFFLVMGGFWVSNTLHPGWALDSYSQSGVCYEAVHSCSCLWHV